MKTIIDTPVLMWTIVIIGITTVFLCLIALVLMVGIFKFIFARTAKADVKKTGAGASASMRGVDAAIVAVIIAAIAASSGIPASSLRIASIERSGERSGFNTPVWGHIDRV